jgi:hypothetical protein
MVLPVSRRVPRVPRYLGTGRGSLSRFAYGACTLYRRPFQIVRLRDRFLTPRRHCRDATSGPATPSIQCRQACTYREFGLFPVRSPLLGESRLLSVPPGTEMVHFPGLAAVLLCIQRTRSRITLEGLPHSEIFGSKPVCGSPKLIAAYHVLLRRPAPRHPPYALSSLTTTSTLLETCSRFNALQLLR